MSFVLFFYFTDFLPSTCLHLEAVEQLGAELGMCCAPFEKFIGIFNFIKFCIYVQKLSSVIQ